MARNSAKNSAKFAHELSIRPAALGSYGTTASGNLVVDRTASRDPIPWDSNPDMLTQSQLSCNLPLLLICPDYAICVCILKGIGDPNMHPTP
jgi:hypothetical protein